MSNVIDHRAGQYRAELFEELVGYLLQMEFPDALIRRHFVLPKSWQGESSSSLSIDFFIKDSEGRSTLVETKAPYSENSAFGINKTVRRLKDLTSHWPESIRVKRVILAVAAPVPEQSYYEMERGADYFQSGDIRFDVWDAGIISELLMKHFHLRPATFSVEDIENVLTKVRQIAEAKGGGKFVSIPPQALPEKVPSGPPAQAAPTREEIREGEKENVIVLSADFCSYSRFVQSSGGDRDLITSVMRRFYRDTRSLIESSGGIVDKYMGDGILAFWTGDAGDPKALAASVNECIYQLVGTCLNIAKEWQDQIDFSVRPTGMRCGAALGKVLFISENRDGKPPMHAISEAINLSARLQSAADPNSLVIANRLRKSYFADDPEFVEMEPLEAKNIGEVRAWKKDYEAESVEAAATAT